MSTFNVIHIKNFIKVEMEPKKVHLITTISGKHDLCRITFGQKEIYFNR